MKVVLSANAESDLFEIGVFISQDSNERSISFVRELRGACTALGGMPRAFPLIHAATGIRRKPYKSHLIFYVILDDAVQIARVIHAARDYMKIVFPTPPLP